MLSVKALAGYIDGRAGRHLAYALYVNNLPLRGFQDLLGQDLGQISTTCG